MNTNIGLLVAALANVGAGFADGISNTNTGILVPLASGAVGGGLEQRELQRQTAEGGVVPIRPVNAAVKTGVAADTLYAIGRVTGYMANSVNNMPPL
jgi:hypothetical protein